MAKIYYLATVLFASAGCSKPTIVNDKLRNLAALGQISQFLRRQPLRFRAVFDERRAAGMTARALAS